MIEKLVRSCPEIKRIYLLIRDKRGKDVKDRLTDLLEAQVSLIHAPPSMGYNREFASNLLFWCDCEQIFNRIKSQKNGRQVLEAKLRAIKGDITLPKFGVAKDDLVELAQEVSIVFNSAATIRFVEPIDVAVRNNIYSVSQLVEFCDELNGLQALVHLSTAYSNCHKRDTIHEIFYEPPMRGDQIISAVNSLKRIQDEIHLYPSIEGQLCEQDEVGEPSRSACKPQTFYKRDRSVPNRQNVTSDLLDEFTRIALRRSNRPNTYTFTKAISESYLLDLIKLRPERYLNEKIPVAIVRPSIVGGAWREPDVGLVDNYNGPTGAILSLYTGALQAMPGRGERIADLVPVDMVANMLLCTGWHLVNERCGRAESTGASKQPKRDRGAYVFNFVSGNRNPLRWHQVTDLIADLAYRYPSKMLARLPSSYFIRAGQLYEVYDLLNHWLPARLSDFARGVLLRQELSGRSSALVAYSRIRQMTETLTPFTSNEWRLNDANVCALYERLPSQDRQLFQFDVAMIDWNEYIRNYIIGSRIYTLRDEARNVPAALATLRK